MKKFMYILMLPAVLFISACDSDSTGTVVDEILSRDDTSTLGAAIIAAGLTDTLDGEGPFTVFAPVNEAFAALPAGTVDALLADPPALANILTYHVVAGDLKAADVVAVSSLQTVQGGSIQIRVDEDGNVKVDNANIIATDIDASNGTIHLIDAVLLP